MSTSKDYTFQEPKWALKKTLFVPPTSNAHARPEDLFKLNEIEKCWQEDKQLRLQSLRANARDELSDNIPPPSRSRQTIYGELRQRTQEIKSREELLPKYENKRGKKSIYYGWSTLQEILDSSIAPPSNSYENSSSLRAQLNKPPANGFYWGTSKQRSSSLSDINSKRNVLKSKQLQSTEQSKNAKSKYEDYIPHEGATFKDIFGSPRRRHSEQKRLYFASPERILPRPPPLPAIRCANSMENKAIVEEIYQNLALAPVTAKAESETSINRMLSPMNENDADKDEADEENFEKAEDLDENENIDNMVPAPIMLTVTEPLELDSNANSNVKNQILNSTRSIDEPLRAFETFRSLDIDRSSRDYLEDIYPAESEKLNKRDPVLRSLTSLPTVDNNRASLSLEIPKETYGVHSNLSIEKHISLESVSTNNDESSYSNSKSPRPRHSLRRASQCKTPDTDLNQSDSSEKVASSEEEFIYDDKEENIDIFQELPGDNSIVLETPVEEMNVGRTEGINLKQFGVLENGDVRSYTPTQTYIETNFYDNIPDYITKNVRIYLASSGEDMRFERETIQYGAVPELQDYCKGMGLDFQLIDLADAYIDRKFQNDPTILESRMFEIENCFEVSCGPSFIGLLGNKFGYQIPPRLISKVDMEILLTDMELYHDTQLTLMVYELDYNVVPVSFSFVPRNIETIFRGTLQPPLSNCTFDELNELVNKQLSNAFQTAALTAFKLGHFTEEQRDRFCKSVLSTEIQHALALSRSKNFDGKMIVFKRDFTGSIKGNIDILQKFYDLDENDKIDFQRQRLLTSLKKDVANEIISKYFINKSVAWDKACGVDPETVEEHALYMQALNDSFIETVKSSIEVSTLSITSIDIENEKYIHLRKGKELSAFCIERKDVWDACCSLMMPHRGSTLYIVGEEGCGKSTLVSMLPYILNDKNNENLYILRFIGSSIKSQDCLELLVGIILEILYLFKMLTPDLCKTVRSLSTLSSLTQYLISIVKRLPLTATRNLYILIDGVENLKKARNVFDFHWVPKKLSSFASIIMTTNSDYLPILLLSVNSARILKIDELPMEIVLNSIHFRLGKNARVLSEFQMENLGKVISNNKCSSSIKYILEEVKDWKHSFDASNTEELFKHFNQACTNYINNIIKKSPPIMMYILALVHKFQKGVSLIEIKTVLSYIDDVLINSYSQPPSSYSGILQSRDSYIATCLSNLNCALKFEFHRGFLLVKSPHKNFRNSLEKLFFQPRPAQILNEVHKAAAKYLLSKHALQEPIIYKFGDSGVEYVKYCADFSLSSNIQFRTSEILPSLLLSVNDFIGLKEKCLHNFVYIHNSICRFGSFSLIAEYRKAMLRNNLLYAIMIDLIQGLAKTFPISMPEQLALYFLLKLDKFIPTAFTHFLENCKSFLENHNGYLLRPKHQILSPCCGYMRQTYNLNLGTLLELKNCESGQSSACMLSRSKAAITRFDVESQEVLWSIDVEAQSLIVSPDSKLALMVNSNRNPKNKDCANICLYDLHSSEVIATRPVIPGQKFIAFSKDSKYLYVAVSRSSQRENSRIVQLRTQNLAVAKSFEVNITANVVEDLLNQKTIIIGGDHNDECLLRLRTDKEAKSQIRGIKGAVTRIYSCNHGSLAVLGIGINAIAIVDLKKCRVLTQQAFDSNRWMAVMKVSLNEKYVVCGDANPGVVIFDIAKSEIYIKLANENSTESRVIDAEISPNGNFCLVADNSDQRSVSLYNCEKGSCLYSFNAISSEITCIASFGRFSYFAAGLSNGDVKVWNIAAIYRPVANKHLVDCDEEETAIRIIKHNCGDNPNILNYVMPNCIDDLQLGSPRTQVDVIKSFQYEQKDFIITGSAKSGFRIWECDGATEFRQIKLENSKLSETHVDAVVLQPSNAESPRIALIFNWKIHLYSVRQDSCLFTLQFPLKVGCISKSSKLYITYNSHVSSNSGRIAIWNMSYEKVEKIVLFEITHSEFGEISRMKCSNDNNRLICFFTNSWDNTIYLEMYDAKNGRKISKYKMQETQVQAHILLKNWLISCVKDQSDNYPMINCWHSESGNIYWYHSLEKFNSTVNIFILRNDQQLIGGFLNGAIGIWNISDLKDSKQNFIKVDAHESSISALQLLQNGQTLLTGSIDGWIKVWSVTNWSLMTQLFCEVRIDDFIVINNDSFVVHCDQEVTKRFSIVKLIDQCTDIENKT